MFVHGARADGRTRMLEALDMTGPVGWFSRCVPPIILFVFGSWRAVQRPTVSSGGRSLASHNFTIIMVQSSSPHLLLRLGVTRHALVDGGWCAGVLRGAWRVRLRLRVCVLTKNSLRSRLI